MADIKRSLFTHEMFLLCAVGLCITRDAIFKLEESEQVKKAISQQLLRMTNRGEIVKGQLNDEEKKKRRRKSTSNSDKACLDIKKDAYRLGTEGVEILKSSSPAIYDFYSKYAEQRHNCFDKDHLRPNKRAGDVVSIMYKAGIKIGPQKPSLMDIEKGICPPLNQEEKTFYLRREQKREEGQREDWLRSSRSCGMVITPNLTGLVYRIDSNDHSFSGSNEKKAAIRARNIVSRAYQTHKTYLLRDGLIIGDSYDDFLLFMKDTLTASSIHVKNVHDAVAKPSQLGGEKDHLNIRFIPFDYHGVTLLKILSSYSDDEIKRAVFSDKELLFDRSMRCDAYIESRNIECYEFLSSNMTKMESVKKRCQGKYENLGIVCFDFQKDFIKELFETETSSADKIHFRVFRYDMIKNDLEGFFNG